MRKAAMVTGLFLALQAASAVAAVYRCQDGDGRVSYSQTPCPRDQQERTLHGMDARSQSAEAAAACKAARAFASGAFEELRAGLEIPDQIEALGGVNYISPPLLNVLNFVNQYRYNERISAHAVGRLAQAKCRNGGFGTLSAADFPRPAGPAGDRMPAAPSAAESPAEAPPTVDYDQLPPDWYSDLLKRSGGAAP